LGGHASKCLDGIYEGSGIHGNRFTHYVLLCQEALVLADLKQLISGGATPKAIVEAAQRNCTRM